MVTNQNLIFQVTVQLEKMFKRSITYVKVKDRGLANAIERLGKRFEFSDVMWYPSYGEVVYRMDERVSSDIYGNGSYDSLLFTATSSEKLASDRSIGTFIYTKHTHSFIIVSLQYILISLLKQKTKTEEELQLHGNSDEICQMAWKISSSLLSLLYGLKNNGRFLLYIFKDYVLIHVKLVNQV